MSLRELTPILQTAVGPVILISGVGLLLLSMTNRLGRAIDRARALAEARRRAPQYGKRLDAQLEILARRARLIRLCITLATFSVLFAAVLIMCLFIAAFFQLETAPLIAALFVLCMATLIGSLIVFLQDINLSLAALKHEVEWPPDDPRAQS